MRAGVFVLSFVSFLMLSGISVSADTVRFGYHYGDNGLYVHAFGNENDKYSLSVNGGVNFFPMSERDIYLSNLPEGDLQLCVMKNNDKGTISDITAVHTEKNYSDKNEDIPLICEGIRENSFREGAVRVTIKNFSMKKKYMVSVNGGMTWQPADGKVTVFHGLTSGEYKVIVRSEGGRPQMSRFVSVTVPGRVLSDRFNISAPLVMQLPDLPTGCEVTSLTMALRFYGLKVEKTTLADFFLEKTDYQTGDFREKFVGSPRDIKAYGCYSGVIVKCARKYLYTVRTRSFETVDLTGCRPEQLYQYVDMGYPVIVWATQNMIPSVEGASWVNEDTGKVITWTGNEHCMLLTGYDIPRGYVYVNDPLFGRKHYKISEFEQRFKELESQAVMIVETTKN